MECGCSSGVEHNLAKVRVEGSNPFARSKISQRLKSLRARGNPGFRILARKGAGVLPNHERPLPNAMFRRLLALWSAGRLRYGLRAV